MEKIIGIIPSRYGSSRFPGKPLIDLKGKSMIQRVYEGALKCERFDKVLVATDDERIFQHVENFGGEVMMTQSTHQSGTDRCAEVMEKFSDYSIAVNIQGDEPLVNAIQLQKLLTAFYSKEVQIATLGIRRSLQEENLENPNRIKLVQDASENALYFSRSLIPFFQNEPTEGRTYMRHIGLYAYRRDALLKISKLPVCELEQIESLEQLRWLYNGFKIKVVSTDIETPNIDTPDDVAKVLNLLA